MRLSQKNLKKSSMLYNICSAGLCEILYFNITWVHLWWSRVDTKFYHRTGVALFSRLQIERSSWFFVATLPETIALYGKANKNISTNQGPSPPTRHLTPFSNNNCRILIAAKAIGKIVRETWGIDHLPILRLLNSAPMARNALSRSAPDGELQNFPLSVAQLRIKF